MIKVITYNKEVDSFIKIVEKKCRKYGIKLLFSLESYVKWDEENKSNGYFDDESKELAVATKKPMEKWFHTLVHESCHFDQWTANCEVWRAYNRVSRGEDHLTTIVNNTSKLTKSQKAKVIKVTREIELDCEKRAVKKIKKYNLPVNLDDYVRRANAYVYFYNFIGKHNKWYKIGHEPYNNEKILKLMVTDFNNNYSELPKKLEKLYWECV